MFPIIGNWDKLSNYLTTRFNEFCLVLPGGPLYWVSQRYAHTFEKKNMCLLLCVQRILFCFSGSSVSVPCHLDPDPWIPFRGKTDPDPDSDPT